MKHTLALAATALLAGILAASSTATSATKTVKVTGDATCGYVSPADRDEIIFTSVDGHRIKGPMTITTTTNPRGHYEIRLPVNRTWTITADRRTVDPGEIIIGTQDRVRVDLTVCRNLT